MDTRTAFEQYREEGLRILADRGIHDWVIGLDSARSRLGVCNYRHRRITLSRSFVEHATPDEIRDTVLHEVAHAIAGPTAKHGPAWRIVARSIGCRASRCGQNPEGRPAGRYTGECPNHGVIAHRWRLTQEIQRYVCGKCRSEITWKDHGPAGVVAA